MQLFYQSARTLMFLLLTLLALTARVYGQDPPQYGTPFAEVPDPRDITMYQVNIRPYSPASNLAGVTARLDQIKALGINVVYLLPVFPVGTDSRSKIASSTSPYSIKDFTSVGAEYGSLSDLRALVDGAHSRGMAVLLDWVANQTSWDHPWIREHPDWYVRDASGVIQPLNPFPDVAALDFNNPAMRTAMIQAMRYWVLAANIDGFRCDYANNAPLAFWSQAIANLRGITSRKLILFAEGDRLTNFQAGFDLNFGDKFYYDALKPIRSGASVAQIQTTTDIEYTHAGPAQQVVRYTGNHDTSGEGTPLEVFTSPAGVMANFVVSAYMRGVPFLYGGQEVAFPTRIPWPWDGVDINWSPNPAVTEEFTRVIGFRNSSTAIRRGTMSNYSDQHVCAFAKTAGTEKVVVLVNLRNGLSSYTVPAALAGTYRDAYSGASVTLTAGATLALNAFQYRTLTNANVPVVAVTGVSVSPASFSIRAGVTQQLTATVSPANATNQNVSWTSSNPAVATVNAAGLVTAVAAGSATVTVTTQDGNKTASAAVTVTPGTSFTVHFYRPANWGTGIRIYWWAAQPAGTLPDGSWPGVNMTNAGNGWYNYTFTNITSTNLIFNDGTNQTADLTRNKTGWYLNGAWYDSDPGTPIAVTGVAVSPTSATVAVNATTQLTATVAPANASNKTVTWASSNTAVATVGATGLVTGKSGGTATITVTTQDGNKTAACAITVPTTGNTTYYQIVNRWQPGTYLYDAGNGQVRYGTSPSSASYQWARIDVGGGYYQLKNRATGNLMHVENQNGSVQCSAIDPAWWSAMWSLPAATDGWLYVQNRWQPSQRINIEGLTGYAQYSGTQAGWHSAMWQFVNPQSGKRSVEPEGEKLPLTVAVFPNPAKGRPFKVAVSGTPGNSVTKLFVRDVYGRVALSKELDASGAVMHTLPAGLYLLTVSVGDTHVTKKLLVE